MALSEIGEWPTHQRFLKASAGRVAFTEEQLKQEINRYLKDGQADQDARRKFIKEEVTFTDGSAGRRTGELLAGLASDNNKAKGAG